jgi:hypothetical protein
MCANIIGDECAIICAQWEWALIVEALREFNQRR